MSAGNGNDTLDASGLSNNRVQLGLFGDAGDDRIIGSAGADFINGGVGAVTRLRGELFSVGAFTVQGSRIVAIDIQAAPERLARLDLTYLGGN